MPVVKHCRYTGIRRLLFTHHNTVCCTGPDRFCLDSVIKMASNKNPTLVNRKVAVLGARAVGKSSLTHSFVTGSFSDAYDPTIESTQHKTIRFRKVHFATDIVDTAGMDEFSRLSRNASLGVHGYILVFSIASRQSFETIDQVNDALLNTLGDAPDVPRVLVGSMKDLSDSRPGLGGFLGCSVLGMFQQNWRACCRCLSHFAQGNRKR